MRIMTGAPVPRGADAVIPVEWTDGAIAHVRIDREVAEGAHIRRVGSDIIETGVPEEERIERVFRLNMSIYRIKFTMNLYVLRGRMQRNLHKNDDAVKDFTEGFRLLPNSAAAVNLGEIAEEQKRADEAIRLWVKDSPIEGSKDAMTQADALRQAESLYGPYQWYEIIRAREISPRTLTIDLVLDYERGPLFARFVVYRANHRWVMTYFDFSFREETLFPTTYYPAPSK